MIEAIDIFPWNENFETGITEIDKQHKVIVSIINEMANHLCNHSDIDTLDKIFDKLTEYASYHFESEERIWQQYLPQDSYFKKHQDSHNQFLSSIRKIKAGETSNPIQKVNENILYFLTHWLEAHILDSDMRMSKMILAIESGLSIENAKQQAEKEMSNMMNVMFDTTLSMYDHLRTRTLELKREINQRKKAETKLRLASCVFDNTLEAICITDANSFIIDANPSFYQSTGYLENEVIGQHITKLKSGLKDKQLIASIWRQLKKNNHWSGEVHSRNKEGELQAEWLALSTIRNEHNTIINYIGIFSNISRLIKNQLKLEHIAHHDVLTGLPNRLLLADRLEQSIALARRNNELFAVCYLDLDGFKTINDQYGHATGDLLLSEIAQRIKIITRGSDTAARVGGDEFVIILNELTSPEGCKELINRLLEEIAHPIEIDNIKHKITASIGVAICPNDSNDPETLLQLADKAMYQAKRSGKSRYQLYT